MAGAFNPDAPYWVMLREAEKRILQGAWDQTLEIERAASLLGVSRVYYQKRLRVLGLQLGPGRRRRTADYSRAYPARFDRAGRTLIEE